MIEIATWQIANTALTLAPVTAVTTPCDPEPMGTSLTRDSCNAGANPKIAPVTCWCLGRRNDLLRPIVGIKQEDPVKLGMRERGFKLRCCVAPDGPSRHPVPSSCFGADSLFRLAQ